MAIYVATANNNSKLGCKFRAFTGRNNVTQDRDAGGLYFFVTQAYIQFQLMLSFSISPAPTPISGSAFF